MTSDLLLRPASFDARPWDCLLASQVDLSISQLERGFTRHVGVGPKLLARQTRVCALAAEATTLANPGWALLAARYGYADQAHLARVPRTDRAHTL